MHSVVGSRYRQNKSPKDTCALYEQASKEMDNATLALSQAKRKLKAAEKALAEAAKRTKEEAHEKLKMSEGAKAAASAKRGSQSTGCHGDDRVLVAPVAQPVKKKAKTAVSEPKKKTTTKKRRNPGAKLSSWQTSS